MSERKVFLLGFPDFMLVFSCVFHVLMRDVRGHNVWVWARRPGLRARRPGLGARRPGLGARRPGFGARRPGLGPTSGFGGPTSGCGATSGRVLGAGGWVGGGCRPNTIDI